MLDLNEKVFASKAMKRKLTALDAIEDRSSSSSSSSSKRSTNGGIMNEKKSCTNCGTNKTPLWRGGPAGPKSLCNACGIKNRKRRRTVNMGSEDKKKKPKKVGNVRRNQKLSEFLRSSMGENQRRRKLGEEEQAAILLMALSYASSVYA